MSLADVSYDLKQNNNKIKKTLKHVKFFGGKSHPHSLKTSPYNRNVIKLPTDDIVVELFLSYLTDISIITITYSDAVKMDCHF